MKKILNIIILIFFFVLSSLIFILSTSGYETHKFNEIISSKITKKNKYISLQFEKIKFKIDFKNISLFLETKNPKLNYQNVSIPIKNIKVYLDFISIIKSKPKIDKINIISKEINIDQLKKIIVKTKPSNFNSLVTNKVKNGRLVTDLEIYFNDNLNINNFIARGQVIDTSVNLIEDLTLNKLSFDFFTDSTDTLIKNIQGETPGFLFKKGDLQIKKGNNINIKSDFITNINLNKNNIKSYLTYLKKNKYINEKIDLKTNLNHNIDITFDDTYKVINYIYNTNGKIDELIYQFSKPIKNNFFDARINNFTLKDSTFSSRYSSDKNNYIQTNGIYKINDYNFLKYNFKNNFLPGKSNVDINFEFDQKLNIDFINYSKDVGVIANIYSNFNIDKDLISFKKIKFQENRNLILVEKLKIDKKNLVSLDKVIVKTFNKGNLNNDFSIDFEKKIKIYGNKYDALNLVKIINKKSENNILKKINKEIEINLKNIETSLSKRIQNFNLIGTIKKGEFVKILSKGDFGDNKYLDISLKSDKKNKKKYLEIYSDLPQPLLSDYSFFKGVTDGTLTYSSIIEGNLSNSKLLIENFKIVNAPGVVKLLSLADFGGLADLAEGDGLSFKKLEIKMTNEKNFLKIDELYAVGPSISVLMDGYKEANGLTSLRGTLVPAKNLNILLSKIPVIGKIIIPKEIGEGLFGVSFKMKGPSGKIKTTINPIKTLTPRFITKALEKKTK
jgi:hypothetical protein